MNVKNRRIQIYTGNTERDFIQGNHTPKFKRNQIIIKI